MSFNKNGFLVVKAFFTEDEVNTLKQDAEKAFKKQMLRAGIISKEDISGFIIQPTYGIAEPSLDQLLKFYDLVHPYFKEVRVVPQLHKLIGAP